MSERKTSLPKVETNYTAPKVKPPKEPPKRTLNERIEMFLIETDHEDSDAMKRGIKLLIERATHPESFCPECDERTFYTGGQYVCINCGWKEEKSATIQPPKAKSQDIKKLVDQIKGNKPASEDEAIIKAQDKNITGDINWS